MTNPQPPTPRRTRLVPRGEDDRSEIIRTGARKLRLSDLYVQLLSASWVQLLCLIVACYLSINIFYALAYFFIGGIENARDGSFLDAFFFSIQTMSTIGYGKMVPVGLAANILVTLQVLTGFVFFAVTTGLVFTKFSRPTARMMFSNVAVICPYDGVPHFMLRIANERNNRIVDAEIRMFLLRKEKTKEGHQMRRFYDLPLVRQRVPVFQLTWTAMHIIDAGSPLYNATPESLSASDTEIIVTVKGMDETLSQHVHARYSYIPGDIICNAAFVDILNAEEDGRVEVDYRHFHEVRRLG